MRGTGVGGGEGGVVVGFRALVRLEASWGEAVVEFVLREEMIFLREAILFEVEVLSWT